MAVDGLVSYPTAVFCYGESRIFPAGGFSTGSFPRAAIFIMRFQTAIYQIGLGATLLLVGGCSSTIQWPDFSHPGPIGYQRYAALSHDPYPLPDLGPPVVGGRPLSYQRPVPKAVRDQTFVPPPPRPGYPWR
jgi:hypothetical protein